MWCTFATRQHKDRPSSINFQKLRYTEFETTKIAVESVKFYRLLVIKLGLSIQN